MAELPKLIVIYNPFSGRRKLKNLPQMVINLLADSHYNVLVWPTEKASDVTLLTERAIREKASMVVLKEGARYDWMHGIKMVKTDNYFEHKIVRKRRVSLTFRKVILEY